MLPAGAGERAEKGEGSHQRPVQHRKREAEGFRLRNRRKEFVAVDSGGDTAPAIMGCDTNHLPEASDINLSGEQHFLRERQNKFNFCALLKRRLRKEIQPAKTDIARARKQFPAPRTLAPDAHGQTYREAPRCASLRCTLRHPPGSCAHSRPKANTFPCAAQCSSRRPP